jgi:sterol desaturase/sphingolipid hydroxylase (fatty acid hydroxylase superfamily)
MDTVGGGLPVLLLDMHPWTATLFTSFATIKTVHDHCGYRVAFRSLSHTSPHNTQTVRPTDMMMDVFHS